MNFFSFSFSLVHTNNFDILYNVFMKKIIFFFLFYLGFLACNPSPSIEGAWIQPVPLKKGEFHGMVFEKGGLAKSINMPNFQYETWQQDGNKLTLTGKTLYQGESFIFTESYTIKSASPTMLVLINNSAEEMVFARQQ